MELPQKPGKYKGPFGWRGHERGLTRLKMIEEQRFHSVGESMLVQKEKEGEENDICLITLFYIYLRLYTLHTHTHTHTLLRVTIPITRSFLSGGWSDEFQ